MALEKLLTLDDMSALQLPATDIIQFAVREPVVVDKSQTIQLLKMFVLGSVDAQIKNL